MGPLIFSLLIGVLNYYPAFYITNNKMYKHKEIELEDKEMKYPL